MNHHRARVLGLVLLTCLVARPAPVEAEPRIQLKVSPFATTFANFSSVVLPPAGYDALEIWLQDALEDIQVSTIRITLNEMPMTPFVSLNPLPRGFRAIIKVGATLSPEYALRPNGENLISFVAMDASKVTYRGQFYVSIDKNLKAPQAGSVARAKPPVTEIQAPARAQPPHIVIRSEWPRRTELRVLTLDAEVSDVEGLRRVVLEVNGKDVEEIVLENERPVRKQGGWVARSRLPGDVTGDGRRLVLSIPVKLTKDLTVVALRAENLAGLRARADRIVESTWR